jgi:hypothetical protein
LLDAAAPPAGTRATLTLAERDVVEPLDGALRLALGRRVLERAGLQVEVAVP